MFEINVFSISVTDSGGRDDVIHRWITVQTATRNEFQRKGWDKKKKRSTGSQLMSGLVCFWLGGLFMWELKKKKKEPRQSERFKKKIKKNLLTDTSQVFTLWKVARREAYWSPNIAASGAGENIYEGENVVLLWRCPSLRRRLGEDSWWCRRWGSASRLKDTDPTRWRAAADTLTAIENLCGVEDKLTDDGVVLEGHFGQRQLFYQQAHCEVTCGWDDRVTHICKHL